MSQIDQVTVADLISILEKFPKESEITVGGFNFKDTDVRQSPFNTVDITPPVLLASYRVSNQTQEKEQ